MLRIGVFLSCYFRFFHLHRKLSYCLFFLASNREKLSLIGQGKMTPKESKRGSHDGIMSLEKCVLGKDHWCPKRSAFWLRNQSEKYNAKQTLGCQRGSCRVSWKSHNRCEWPSWILEDEVEMTKWRKARGHSRWDEKQPSKSPFRPELGAPSEYEQPLPGCASYCLTLGKWLSLLSFNFRSVVEGTVAEVSSF